MVSYTLTRDEYDSLMLSKYAEATYTHDDGSYYDTVKDYKPEDKEKHVFRCIGVPCYDVEISIV